MSYISSYHHCVFSIKERRPMLTESLAERLYPYLAGIARENQFRAVGIGGIEDHIHILVSLPSTITIAKAMQLLKGGSSKWIHDTFPEHRTFAWQKKYGSFSVSISQLDTVIAYIRRQNSTTKSSPFRPSSSGC